MQPKLGSRRRCSSERNPHSQRAGARSGRHHLGTGAHSWLWRSRTGLRSQHARAGPTIATRKSCALSVDGGTLVAAGASAAEKMPSATSPHSVVGLDTGPGQLTVPGVSASGWSAPEDGGIVRYSAALRERRTENVSPFFKNRCLLPCMAVYRDLYVRGRAGTVMTNVVPAGQRPRGQPTSITRDCLTPLNYQNTGRGH